MSTGLITIMDGDATIARAVELTEKKQALQFSCPVPGVELVSVHAVPVADAEGRFKTLLVLFWAKPRTDDRVVIPGMVING